MPRMVPVMAETDVMVVGSGPAGLAAALGAAREGVKTMLPLIETDIPLV